MSKFIIVLNVATGQWEVRSLARRNRLYAVRLVNFTKQGKILYPSTFPKQEVCHA